MGRALAPERSILIVEDEALIRHDLVDFFQEADFRVFEAEHAEEAIAILARHRTVRVVLTDVQMPGSMDGVKLAHYIRKRYPPTVLFVTSGQRRLLAADLPERSVFVPKPFDPNRVLLQIERLAF